jgi:Flp pilus assembly pilin Flp
LVLVAVVVIIILALVGPAIGNIFSEIVEAL